MLSRRLGGIALVALAVGASLYWVAWRSKFIRAPGEPPSVRQVERERQIERVTRDAREAYKALTFMPKADIASITELDEKIGPLISEDLTDQVRSDHGPYSTGKLEKIRRDLVGLIYYRWFQPDFDAYDAFMLRCGYVLPETFGEIRDGRKYSLSRAYPVWTGKPFDPSRSPRDSLRDLWLAGPPGDGYAARLRAFPVDPAGIEIGVVRACPGDDTLIPLSGTLGESAWRGETIGTCARFYQPKSGWYHDALARGGCVDLATVGVILKFENGGIYPFRFKCWYDTQTQNWYIYSVTIARFGDEFGGVIF